MYCTYVSNKFTIKSENSSSQLGGVGVTSGLSKSSGISGHCDELEYRGYCVLESLKMQIIVSVLTDDTLYEVSIGDAEKDQTTRI